MVASASRWGPLGAGPADAESLGPGIRPRSESSGAVSDRCLACDKKRKFDVLPASWFNNHNRGPPGLAPELGIINKSLRSPHDPNGVHLATGCLKIACVFLIFGCNMKWSHCARDQCPIGCGLLR